MKYKVLMSILIIALALIPLACNDESSPNGNTTPNGNLTPNGNATQGGLIMGVNWTEMNETEFLVVAQESGLNFTKYPSEDCTVYQHLRKIDDARVIGDEIYYRFNTDGTFAGMRFHWTEGLPDTLPEIISEQEAIDIVGQEKTTTRLAFIQSTMGMLYNITPTNNPCWIVSVWQDRYDPVTNETYTWNVAVVVVDAVTGEILGHGTPIP